eukprot:m.200136 g.200136  ORF g.200136 m.200136 type:complete len:388 (-) comp32762_c0_seq1:54-1217(-)
MGGCLGKKNPVDDGGTDEQRRATRTRSVRSQKSVKNPGIMLEAEMTLGMEENPMSMYQQVDPEPKPNMPTYVDVGSTETAVDYMDMSGNGSNRAYVNTQIGSANTRPVVMELKYDSVDPRSFEEDTTAIQNAEPVNYSVVNKKRKPPSATTSSISAGVQSVDYEAMGIVNQPFNSAAYEPINKSRTDSYVYTKKNPPEVADEHVSYDEVIPDGFPSTPTVTTTYSTAGTTNTTPPPQAKKKTEARKESDRCWNCKKFAPENVAMKVCGACRTARYCSKGCQVTHWTKTHVKECGSIVDSDKKPGPKKHKYVNSEVTPEIEVEKQRYVNANVRVENADTGKEPTQPPARQKSTYQNVDLEGKVIIKKSRYVNNNLAILQATRDAESET